MSCSSLAFSLKNTHMSTKSICLSLVTAFAGPFFSIFCHCHTLIHVTLQHWRAHPTAPSPAARSVLRTPAPHIAPQHAALLPARRVSPKARIPPTPGLWSCPCSPSPGGIFALSSSERKAASRNRSLCRAVLHFGTECGCEGAPGAPGHIDVLPLTAQHLAALGEEAPAISLLSSAFRQGLSLTSVLGEHACAHFYRTHVCCVSKQRTAKPYVLGINRAENPGKNPELRAWALEWNSPALRGGSGTNASLLSSARPAGSGQCSPKKLHHNSTSATISPCFCSHCFLNRRMCKPDNLSPQNGRF